MGELVFVGLGLHDENGVSLRGLQEMREANSIFAELYTSLMEGLNFEEMERMAEKKIVLVSRRMVEEENGARILAAALKGKTVFLVPGDPLIATTHIDLRIRAEEAGIETSVIHGASIISAVMGLSGLQNYKFGRSVSIPYFDSDAALETPYDVIKRNLKAGLHTLCFLDIQAQEKRYMTIKEALEALMAMEKRKRESTVSGNTLVVGLARVGSRSGVVKAGSLDEVLNYDFGGPPFTLIVPAKLHFMEAKALIKLADAPEYIGELIR